MTAEKKSPARKPRQATAPVMEKIIDVEPIGKPGSPQVEAHEISTKTQRAEDSQAEALRDIISRDIAELRTKHEVLLEENRALKSDIEALRYKNEILDPQSVQDGR